MNRHLFISLVFVMAALVFIQCNDKKKEAVKTVKQFTWLTGSWMMKEKEGITTEQWENMNDSLMEGRSDFVKGDSIIPFETIKLFKRNSEFYYEAKAAEQNNELAVEFRLTSITDTSFVAENPQHDFPKRITYRLVNKDSIHAIVDGGPAMPEKKADFYYSKKQ